MSEFLGHVLGVTLVINSLDRVLFGKLSPFVMKLKLPILAILICMISSRAMAFTDREIRQRLIVGSYAMITKAQEKFSNINEVAWFDESLKAGSIERGLLNKVYNYFEDANLASLDVRLAAAEIVLEGKSRGDSGCQNDSRRIAYAEGRKIVICRRALSKSQQSVVPTLVHELVHVAQLSKEFRTYARTTEQIECQASKVEAMVAAFSGLTFHESDYMFGVLNCRHDLVAAEIYARVGLVLSENSAGKNLYFSKDLKDHIIKNNVAGTEYMAILEYPVVEASKEYKSESFGFCNFTLKADAQMELLTTAALIRRVSITELSKDMSPQLKFHLEHPVFEAMTCLVSVSPIISERMFSDLTRGNTSLTPFRD